MTRVGPVGHHRPMKRFMGRRRYWVPFVALALSGVTALLLLPGRAHEDELKVRADGAVSPGPPPADSSTTTAPPSSSTSTTALTSTSTSSTTTTVAAKVRVVASGQGWSVTRTSSATDECLEIRTTKLDRRCGLHTPTRIVEAAAVLPFGDGSLLVALTTREVELLRTRPTTKDEVLPDTQRVDDPFLPNTTVLVSRAPHWAS